ncbi:hypothetical protein PGB90_008681 [Kerria lacca]
MNRSKNKRKRFFSSNLMAKKKKDLFMKTGMKGFICTCNGNEKQCVQESYNILNEYADKLYGEETIVQLNSDLKEYKKLSTDDEDILDTFEKEVQLLKSQNIENTRRFKARNTGIQNCIFIETNLEDPTYLMHIIIKDLFETKQKKSRYLLRMIPVDVTCKAYMDDLEKAARPLFDVHFKSEPITYAIVYNKRCNSNLERDTVIEKLASMIQERNNEHKVNLKSPTVAVIVEVVKNICALSIIQDYFHFYKYNLHSIFQNNNKSSEKNNDYVKNQISEQIDNYYVESYGVLHKILNIKENASVTELKIAYEKLLKQWYKASKTLTAEAELLHLKIVQAYRELKNELEIDFHEKHLFSSEYYQSAVQSLGIEVLNSISVSLNVPSSRIIHNWFNLLEILTPLGVVLVTINMDRESAESATNIIGENPSSFPYLLLLINGGVIPYKNDEFVDFMIIGD